MSSISDNMKEAFETQMNKQQEARTAYDKKKADWLAYQKRLADDLVEHLSFLTDKGYKVFSRRYYEDILKYHHSYEVVIIKPNGRHGGILYPCSCNYICSSYQIYPEGTSGLGCLGRFFYKTWEDLAKALAYSLG